MSDRLHHSPLILTAEMGRSDFAWAEDLRRRYFPAERNQVPAHLTLFHHFPHMVEDELRDCLKSWTRRTPPRAMISDIISLGGGTAYRVISDDLLLIREEIAEHFHGMLTVQDQQRPRFHITVQNKVSSLEAHKLRETLLRQFAPRPLAITGLTLWRYLGGPWELVRSFAFRE